MSYKIHYGSKKKEVLVDNKICNFDEIVEKEVISFNIKGKRLTALIHWEYGEYQIIQKPFTYTKVELSSYRDFEGKLHKIIKDFKKDKNNFKADVEESHFFYHYSIERYYPIVVRIGIKAKLPQTFYDKVFSLLVSAKLSVASEFKISYECVNSYIYVGFYKI